MVDLSAWERAPYSGQETINLRRTVQSFRSFKRDRVMPSVSLSCQGHNHHEKKQDGVMGKNLSAHWKNTLSCQNQKEKKQDVQNYVMLSNSPTVDSKISKIRSDVQNSSAAEDTLQKYMSTFFHFKSICCITTEASSPF